MSVYFLHDFLFRKVSKGITKRHFHSLLVRFKRLVFEEIGLIITRRPSLFHYDRCIFYLEVLGYLCI